MDCHRAGWMRSIKVGVMVDTRKKVDAVVYRERLDLVENKDKEPLVP